MKLEEGRRRQGREGSQLVVDFKKVAMVSGWNLIPLRRLGDGIEDVHQSYPRMRYREAGVLVHLVEGWSQGMLTPQHLPLSHSLGESPQQRGASGRGSWSSPGTWGRQAGA